VKESFKETLNGGGGGEEGIDVLCGNDGRAACELSLLLPFLILPNL
jgi:hypothetical protein